MAFLKYAFFLYVFSSLFKNKQQTLLHTKNGYHYFLFTCFCSINFCNKNR